MDVKEALSTLYILLKQESLTTVQEFVFCETWRGKTYAEMAENSSYDADYLKFVGFQVWRLLSKALGVKVNKSNLHTAFRQEAQRISGLAASEPKNLQNREASTLQHQDWGEAIDVSVFYGRTQELATLEQWIVRDSCRLVALLGIGGIGKTALSVKLAEQIQNEFKYVIWRSLRNAPLIEDILADIIQFLPNHEETDLPETIDGRISRLIDYLRSSRCLLILDNFETVLQSGDRKGRYREEYEGYGQLLRCVAETPHHSCLVLTSREKPGGLAAKEGELAVRSFQLGGLQTAAAREIFKAKGDFWASESEWRVLTEHYGGNPLALKIVAPKIQDFFNGSVSKFLELLKQGAFVFDDIRNLLERQFNRLSDLEKEVMYWLAINREPISFPELQADFLPNIGNSEIIEALVSLQRRSLIEKTSSGFCQQPAVMEYITQQLIERVCAEITAQEPAIFRNHALIKATAKDYIRETQVRLILKPIGDRLLATFLSNSSLEKHLTQFLSTLRGKSSVEIGYAGGNILNLLRQIEADLSGYDLSGLTIRQA